LFHCPTHFSDVKLDVDDNTFDGFYNIRKAIALDDPAQIEYCQDLSVIVRSQLAILLTVGLKEHILQALCGGWPYQSNFNEPLHINASMLLVTSDFDLKYADHPSPFHTTCTDRTNPALRPNWPLMHGSKSHTRLSLCAMGMTMDPYSVSFC
jgi:hypothetical protein